MKGRFGQKYWLSFFCDVRFRFTPEKKEGLSDHPSLGGQLFSDSVAPCHFEAVIVKPRNYLISHQPVHFKVPFEAAIKIVVVERWVSIMGR